MRRWYGHHLAVDGVDLVLPRGAFTGLVGPNGTGATTTLHMLTGLLRPHQGRVVLAGVDVWAVPVTARTRVGVLPADLPVLERLTASELIGFVGALRGLDPDLVDRRRADRHARAGRAARRGGVGGAHRGRRPAPSPHWPCWRPGRGVSAGRASPEPCAAAVTGDRRWWRRCAWPDPRRSGSGQRSAGDQPTQEVAEPVENTDGHTDESGGRALR